MQNKKRGTEFKLGTCLDLKLKLKDRVTEEEQLQNLWGNMKHECKIKIMISSSAKYSRETDYNLYTDQFR